MICEVRQPLSWIHVHSKLTVDTGMAGRVLIEECSKESQGKIKGLSHECRNCLCNKKIGFHPSLKLNITWDKQYLQNFVYKSPL